MVWNSFLSLSENFFLFELFYWIMGLLNYFCFPWCQLFVISLGFFVFFYFVDFLHKSFDSWLLLTFKNRGVSWLITRKLGGFATALQRFEVSFRVLCRRRMVGFLLPISNASEFWDIFLEVQTTHRSSNSFLN